MTSRIRLFASSTSTLNSEAVTRRAVTEYDHLLCAVGRGDAHTVLFADLKRGALNVGICRFRLLCEYNGNVVVADNVLHVTRDAIGIENEDARAG